MTVIKKSISIHTRGNCDIIDVTDEISKELSDSSISNGVVTVFVMGSTAGITTIEHESGLVSDFKETWERIVPKNIPYDHNERWGDGNGYAHVRASLLGASLTVPFADRRMLLGTWQQIVLVDFDNRPRHRTVIVQVMGE